MKILKILMTALMFLMMVGMLFAQVQTPFGPIDMADKSNVAFQAVPIPADQVAYCGAPANASQCGLLRDLATLATTDPDVDGLLKKWRVAIKDASGKVIYPPPVQ
jgi:hypothetical protein